MHYLAADQHERLVSISIRHFTMHCLVIWVAWRNDMRDRIKQAPVAANGTADNAGWDIVRIEGRLVKGLVLYLLLAQIACCCGPGGKDPPPSWGDLLSWYDLGIGIAGCGRPSQFGERQQGIAR